MFDLTVMSFVVICSWTINVPSILLGHNGPDATKGAHDNRADKFEINKSWGPKYRALPWGCQALDIPLFYLLMRGIRASAEALTWSLDEVNEIKGGA